MGHSWHLALLRVDAGQHFPGLLAADAVGGQGVVALELDDGGFGAVTEVAVDRALVEAQGGQGALQVADVVAVVAVADGAADTSVLAPLVFDVAAGLEGVGLLREPAVLVVVAAGVDTRGSRGAGAVEAVVAGQGLVGATVRG